MLMSQQLADFLRRIPQSNQNAQALASLADGLDVSLLQGYILMLKTIGLVKIDAHNQIQATSQTAKYTLNSLASYVEADLRWIDDWKTRGVYRLDERDPLQNGATLLHALDRRRAHQLTNPPPSRHEKVAQVLIKRVNPHTGVPELLFQYDRNASQYQLIGGRHGDKDRDLLTTMIREIEEELADTLRYQVDYDLTLVVDALSPPATLSPTFGALTAYSFWIYHMTALDVHDLHLQPEDCWARIDDVLAGYVVGPDGQRVAFDRADMYTLMDAALDGGLASLPDSFRS